MLNYQAKLQTQVNLSLGRKFLISDHEFLLVLLSYFYRINSIRIEYKGSQIVNMSS